MHVMFVDSNNTFLWQNSEFHKTAEPDIMLNRKVSIEATTISNDCEVSMEPIDFAVDEDIKPMEMVKVEEGMWGIVIYEEEKWLGKVIKKACNQVCVRCLVKPFGVKIPQNLEREDDAIYYDKIYR